MDCIPYTLETHNPSSFLSLVQLIVWRNAELHVHVCCSINQKQWAYISLNLVNHNLKSILIQYFRAFEIL